MEIKEEELEVINATKKALLYSDGQPWTKKGEEDFDIPMGSFDGAEVCELVGLYLLHLLKDTKQDLGLYRDDMLGVTRLRGRSLEKMKQKIQSIFQEAGLKVIGTVGLEATDFLDIFLDLSRPSGLGADGSGRERSVPARGFTSAGAGKVRTL